MSPMKITGITVSIELKRSTYGGADADNRFVSFKGEVPSGESGLDLDAAVLSSLDYHLAAWESLYGAELAAGRIKSEEFNKRIETVRARTKKIQQFLKETPE